jgi:hypothetical protein
MARACLPAVGKQRQGEIVKGTQGMPVCLGIQEMEGQMGQTHLGHTHHPGAVWMENGRYPGIRFGTEIWKHQLVAKMGKLRS